jgi:hypothetical protein
MERTKLSQAGNLAEARAAARMLQRALDLPETTDVTDHLPTEREWARMSYGLRMQKLGDWLRAECFRTGDEGENMTTTTDPMDTVGTRD